MQSQGSGVPESRYTMSYAHSALTGDTGADLYGHGPDSYVNVLQHQHQHIGGHGGSGLSPTNHGMGLNSPGHHQQKRSADVAGLNLKQDPMIGEVTMSTIGLGHGNMDDGSLGGQNGSPNKKTPPPNGKKTKGRVKIKMEFIDNKLRRYTTFSKRKTGIMKKVRTLLDHGRCRSNLLNGNVVSFRLTNCRHWRAPRWCCWWPVKRAMYILLPLGSFNRWSLRKQERPSFKRVWTLRTRHPTPWTSGCRPRASKRRSWLTRCTTRTRK